MTTTDNSDVFRYRTGFLGGLFLGGNADGRLGLTAEILAGRRAPENAKTGGREVWTAWGFQIPIGVRFNLTPPARSRVNSYALAAPALEVLFSRTEFAGGLLVRRTLDTDLVLIGGVGLEVRPFLVEVRYAQGLRNLGTERAPLVTGTIRSRTISLLFGYRIQ